jgi:asparagine synthase (glutamine-hydrolysing)
MGCFLAILNTNGAPADERLLRAMMDVLPFGPPSASHVWTDASVALGHTPLSNRVAPPQPYRRDRLSIVMDGRLDDRGSLVERLEGRTQRPLEAASDAELALAAFERWGTDCAAHLLGDFSFCVWDAERRRLFCARDHLGVKPLYYAHVGTTVVVSNVLRSVRRHPQISTRLDEEAMGDFLLFWACLEPSRTSFADVARVPPAHTLIVSASGGPRLSRYWAFQPEDSLRLRNPSEYIERYVSTLETVVGDRVRSGPAGILMSGGLDSSSVAAAAASVVGPASTPTALRAYTAVYDTVEQDEERHYSTLVARALGMPIEHHAMDAYRWFERWNESLLPPEPSMEPMTAMMADLLEHASRHGGVVLTGDGGDPALLPSTLVNLLGRVSLKTLALDLWRSARRVRSLPPIGVRSAIREWWSPPAIVPPWLTDSFRRRVDLDARVDEIARRRAPADGARGSALSAVVDPWWTAMFEAHDPGATQRPVELRYPLFDVRFLTMALTLPTHPWCVNKTIVRSAMSRLPGEIRARPKSPLAVDVVVVHGRWSLPQAVNAIEAVPELASYVDVHRFRATVREEGLLTQDEPGTLAAVALATWLRCEAAASGAA